MKNIMKSYDYHISVTQLYGNCIRKINISYMLTSNII